MDRVLLVYGTLVQAFPYIALRDSDTPYSEPSGDAKRVQREQPTAATSGCIPPRPSFTSRCPHLPIEVWGNVFGFVRAHSQSDAAQSPLLCKVLRAEAEFVLYREPQLTSLRAALVFADTVSTTPRLARFVCAIAFARWPDDRIPLSETRFLANRYARQRPLDTQLCRLVGMGLAKLRNLTTIVVRDHAAMRAIAAVFDKTNIRLVRIIGDHLDLDTWTVAFLKTHQDVESLRLYHQDAEDFKALGLRRIRVLSCQYRLLSGLDKRHLRCLTSLNVTFVMSKDDIAGIIHLVGPQLVSLRLEQDVWKQQGQLYPTDGHAWDRCPHLKFLHVRHCRPNSNALCYLGDADDAVDATNLPPALETLVWSPAWTRARTHHLYPDERKRREIRRFAEAVLRVSAALRSVIYEWSGETFCKCFLLGSGEFREIPTIAAEADDEAWTYVR